MCGVQMTFVHREERVRWVCERLGLVDVDRRHAGPACGERPDQCPWLDEAARLVFTKRADAFILSRSDRVTIPRVASTRRIWSETTSHCSKKDCLDPATPTSSACASPRDSGPAQTSTFMPNALP